MEEKKNSESFWFLVAVATVGAVIAGIFLSDGFSAFVFSIFHYVWIALVWFFASTHPLPIWLIALLSGIAIGSIISAISRNNEQKRRDSEEYKTSFHRYVTDTFDVIIWIWSYYRDRPTSLYPICARDKTPMVYTVGKFVESPTYLTEYKIWLHCETCGRETPKEMGGDNEIINQKIERQILRKIHSKEYLRVLKALDDAAGD